MSVCVLLFEKIAKFDFKKYFKNSRNLDLFTSMSGYTVKKVKTSTNQNNVAGEGFKNFDRIEEHVGIF